MKRAPQELCKYVPVKLLKNSNCAKIYGFASLCGANDAVKYNALDKFKSVIERLNFSSGVTESMQIGIMLIQAISDGIDVAYSFLKKQIDRAPEEAKIEDFISFIIQRLDDKISNPTDDEI